MKMASLLKKGGHANHWVSPGERLAKRLLFRDAMDEQAAAQLGLEPRGFGRHNLAGVGYGEQLVDARRAHRERNALGARFALKLLGSADAADEGDARIGAGSLIPKIGDKMQLCRIEQSREFAGLEDSPLSWLDSPLRRSSSSADPISALKSLPAFSVA